MNDKSLVFAVISQPVLFAHVAEAQNIGDRLSIVPDICFVAWYFCFLVHFLCSTVASEFQGLCRGHNVGCQLWVAEYIHGGLVVQ